MRLLYVRLLVGHVHFARLSWTFLVMKCFIDSVVQEATFCFIIIVMMLEGFLRQKKKKVSRDFHLHHHNPESFCVRCFIEWQLSLMGGVDWPRVSGQSRQGAIPDHPGKCSCWQGDPMRRKTLVVKSTQVFSGWERGQQGREGSGAGKMHLDFVNLLTI